MKVVRQASSELPDGVHGTSAARPEAVGPNAFSAAACAESSNWRTAIEEIASCAAPIAEKPFTAVSAGGVMTEAAFAPSRSATAFLYWYDSSVRMLSGAGANGFAGASTSSVSEPPPPPPEGFFEPSPTALFWPNSV